MQTPTPALPVPDEISQAHSERVAERIRSTIADGGGSISFARFMHLALYAPGLGYYTAGARKFGEMGDFTTAPETSPLFGRVLARQCAFVLRQLPRQNVLELGPGSGALAVQILKALGEQGIELTRYAMLEVSPDLRQRQEAEIRRHCPEMLSRVAWLEDLPRRFTGAIIANEVADALPVERFVKTGGRVWQYRVTAEDGAFAWCTAPAPQFLEVAVLHIEKSLGTPLPEGYVSEVSTGLPAWVSSLGDSLESGFIFLLDYGTGRRQYYAPERSGGWLRCHFRHRAHSRPLIYPGIQDLSAWVDFSCVAEAASDAGLSVTGYVTQADFLLHGGLEEELSDAQRLSTAAQLEISRQVKMLTLPGQMGEHFKCAGLSRNGFHPPAPFAHADRAHTL